MKNIIIAGPGRNGKTTLAGRINKELNYFVINLDKLMTAFGKAYPQLNIRIAWDYKKATANIAPFLGHYLGMLSSDHGFADDLNLRTHSVKGNKFVLEGGHFDFGEITSIIRTYGINELKDKFILIGLVQNKKTADEFFSDLRKYDTKDEWTYGFDDDELREFSEMSVLFNQEMTDYLLKYGFTIYDTSGERERVFDKIIETICSSNNVEIALYNKWGGKNLRFEWDEEKNKINIDKHKVSFEEASTVFDDVNAVYDYDKSHSAHEDRFIIIGISEGLENKLTVCHCYRGENDEVIRIISARRATNGEIKLYEERII